ncbi:MAG: RluA family pseudouridine synthase [Eubacteriales bacterium]|nr:RluA family pseudouridine synthase [Eubacteriales bacterium]
MKKPAIRRIKYIIPTTFQGRTILDFLKSIGYSRNVISHLKETVNLDVYKVLKGNEEFTLDIVELNNSDNIIPIQMPIDIIYEDDDMVVVNKTSNMPTHPSHNNLENTLGNALQYYYQDRNFVYRPINRLDKDTTGIVIVAKNILSANYLSNMLINFQLSKTYIGIAKGNIYNIINKPEILGTHIPVHDLSRILNVSFEVNLPIKRENLESVRRIVSPQGSEKAITKVIALKYNSEKDLSLCKFKLFTGRTHQIRVHMCHLGYPLIGDFLYNPDYTFINRQALHCNEIYFIHPIIGKMIRIIAKMPKDMKDINI